MTANRLSVLAFGITMLFGWGLLIYLEFWRHRNEAQ
jgi:hypothetical protein